MIVTAWNNGSHNKTGSGYGFKVGKEDRDEHFDSNWESIYLKLPGESEWVKININKDSFWNGCRELICKKIGIWLRERNEAPWPKGDPPKFCLVQVKDNRFEITKRISRV